MSNIDDLIQRLCPDGVDFKALGEIGAVFGGLTGKSRSDFEVAEGARYASYMNVYRNMATDVEPSDYSFGRVSGKPSCAAGTCSSPVHPRRPTSAACHQCSRGSRRSLCISTVSASDFALATRTASSPTS